MLYCNKITRTPRVSHLHHHHPGRSHPPAMLSLSVLRFSAAQRLAVAAVFIALVWALVFWASA